jgi:hypothetical protein
MPFVVILLPNGIVVFAVQRIGFLSLVVRFMITVSIHRSELGVATRESKGRQSCGEESE